MSRCVKTGEAIAEACRVTAETCDELNDIDYGAWQFKSFEQARLQDPALFTAWFATPHLVRFPHGESLQELAARSANALRLVLARHSDDTEYSPKPKASAAQGLLPRLLPPVPRKLQQDGEEIEEVEIERELRLFTISILLKRHRRD